MNRLPICIDLFCGLGGWSEAFLQEGYMCIGFDIERHDYGTGGYPGQLVLQDVLTIHGSQFKDATCIVASPPCQEYSYMAMPWSRGKQITAALRGNGDFPEGYTGSRTLPELTALFDACFRIQREACEAAGRQIPMVVENVRGAQPWVGKAAWNYGSYYLWGDVPALMPITLGRRMKCNVDCAPRRFDERIAASPEEAHAMHFRLPTKNDGGLKVPNFRFDGSGRSFQTAAVKTTGTVNQRESDAVKQPGIGGERKNGKGDAWFQDGAASHGSKSNARKAASAMIAKIPFALARHIARVFKGSHE